MKRAWVWAFLATIWAPAAFAAGAGKPPSRLIVAFRDSVTPEQRRAALAELGLSVADDLGPLNAAVVEGAGGLFHPSAMRLRASPGVVDVLEDVWGHWLVDAPAEWSARPSPGLRDLFDSLARFGRKAAAPPEEAPWGVRRVNAPAAWNRASGPSLGAGARVAVIDTGIDCGHPDLACSYADGYNATDSKKPPKDDNGHGTHVAGTIAARWDGKGVAGVAPLARLMPVKVLDKEGNGWLTSILKGIVWAANHDAQVINMSLGSARGNFLMHMAVKYARSKGTAIVAAAGNEGPGENTISYPGGYDEAIAVAASDSRDAVADFSSRGKQVDFIAPGVDIRSSVPDGKYDEYSGTSMATPHVAGLAALAVAQGARGHDAVAAALRAAAKPVCRAAQAGKPAACLRAEEQGLGMIDAARLIRAR